jgi:signal transduction histidine kinase
VSIDPIAKDNRTEVTRLHALIEEQTRRESVINRIVLLLEKIDDPQKALQVIVNQIGETLELDRCMAMLFSGERAAEYTSEWCAVGVSSVIDDPDVRQYSPAPKWIKEQKCPLIINDVRNHSIAVGLEALVEKIELRSVAVIPIIYRSNIVGLFSAQQTRSYREWSSADIELLNSIAAYSGLILENLRLIKRLREADRLKDEFLSTLSHELRTPLTAINGWLDLLRENPLSEADPDFKEGLDTIAKASDVLTRVIGDLLDLSRIHLHTLTLVYSLADINVIIKNALTSLTQAVLSKNLEVRLELAGALPLTQVDEKRLQKVIWHLLSNAIKFSHEGGLVIVRTSFDKSESDEENSSKYGWISIQVEDRGDGIDPEFLPHIWDRFRQADGSTTRRFGGLGTGLALVKELVEAHNGKVEVKSSSSDGSIFTVRLPVLGSYEV